MSITKLIGISGSLRKGSSNTAFLRTLKDALPQETELELFELHNVPLYNGDHDGANPPPEVQRLKSAIASADGLVISTPEYNWGTSGVLKNALDWASRPANESPLRGKPVLVMSCSPAFTGGARAQSQVRDTLSSALARVIARPPVVIAGSIAKVQDGKFIDEANLSFAREAVADLASEIALLRLRVAR